MLREHGYLAGNRIFEHDPAIEFTQDGCEELFGRFNKMYVLNALAKMSNEIFHGDSVQNIGHVPYDASILHRVTILAVKHCSTDGKTEIKNEHIGELITMAWAQLNVAPRTEGDALSSFILSLANEQFVLDRNAISRLLSRFYEIFVTLWEENENSKGVELAAEIENLFGCRYSEIIFHVLILLSPGQYRTCAMTNEKIESLRNMTAYPFSEDGSQDLLEAVSGTCDQVVEQSLTSGPPFARYPIVVAPEQPLDQKMYLISSPAFLLYRLTYGVKAQVSYAFRGPSEYENSFRSAYGYVFEEYVHKLISSAVRGCQIHFDFTYEKNGSQSKACDFIIHRKSRAVLIESKMSSLSFTTRGTGEMADVAKDLKKNLLKATTQLKKTKRQILIQENDAFHSLNLIKDIELVILIDEAMPYANSIIRKLLEEMHEEKLPYIHIMSIDELEKFLSYKDVCNGLNAALKCKRKRKPDYNFDAYIPQFFKDVRTKEPEYIRESRLKLRSDFRLDEILANGPPQES